MFMFLFLFYLRNRGTQFFCFFFSSRRRHTRFACDWSSDVCSSDLHADGGYGDVGPEAALGIDPEAHLAEQVHLGAERVDEPGGEEQVEHEAAVGHRLAEEADAHVVVAETEPRFAVERELVPEQVAEPSDADRVEGPETEIAAIVGERGPG